MRVELAAEAEAQVLAIDAWWRANRDASPDLFATELERALALLGESPEVGSAYRSGTTAVRRLLLRRTHYHLYYVTETERVLVVAVWSAFRGRGPRL